MKLIDCLRAESEGFWPDFGSYLLFDLSFQRNNSSSLDGNESVLGGVNRNRNGEEAIPHPMVCVVCDGEPVSSSLLQTTPKNGLVPLKGFICRVDDIIKVGEEENKPPQIGHVQSRAAASAGVRLSEESNEPISALLRRGD